MIRLGISSPAEIREASVNDRSVRQAAIRRFGFLTLALLWQRRAQGAPRSRRFERLAVGPGGLIGAEAIHGPPVARLEAGSTVEWPRLSR